MLLKNYDIFSLSFLSLFLLFLKTLSTNIIFKILMMQIFNCKCVDIRMLLHCMFILITRDEIKNNLFTIAKNDTYYLTIFIYLCVLKYSLNFCRANQFAQTGAAAVKAALIIRRLIMPTISIVAQLRCYNGVLQLLCNCTPLV